MRPVALLSCADDTAEIERLIDSCDATTLLRVVQRRPRPAPSTFLGRGKVRDLAVRLADPPISGGTWLAIVNGELRPSQAFNLEAALKVEVWDRNRLILQIFERRAFTKEARLQVEMARLSFELPYVHEAIHRRRVGERPGLLGGGEYEIRAYEAHLKTRQRKVRLDLQRLKDARGRRRRSRKRAGFQLLTIAGYANAGKTSLLNRLGASDGRVENRLFSTLNPRTRRLRQEYSKGFGIPVLLTDTVGFIEALPPWLTDAFSATIEEIRETDGVLLVVDASQSTSRILGRLRTAIDVLSRIHRNGRIVLVLNKQDKQLREEAVTKLHRLQQEPEFSRFPFVSISAKDGDGVRQMLEVVRTTVFRVRRFQVALSQRNPSHRELSAWLHQNTRITSAASDGGDQLIIGEFVDRQLPDLVRRLRACGFDTQAALDPK